MKKYFLISAILTMLFWVSPAKADYICDCEGYRGRDYCYLNGGEVSIHKLSPLGTGIELPELTIYSSLHRDVQEMGYNDYIVLDSRGSRDCSVFLDEGYTQEECEQEYNRGWKFGIRDDELNDGERNQNIEPATATVLREYEYESMGWECERVGDAEEESDGGVCVAWRGSGETRETVCFDYAFFAELHDDPGVVADPMMELCTEVYYYGTDFGLPNYPAQGYRFQYYSNYENCENYNAGIEIGVETVIGSAGGDDLGLPEVVELPNPLARQDESGLDYNPSITQIAGEAIQVVLGIVGSISLVVLIYGAFLWLVSAGNEELVKRGTKTMLFAAIGLFIIFSSYAILSMILNALGASGG